MRERKEVRGREKEGRGREGRMKRLDERLMLPDRLPVHVLS